MAALQNEINNNWTNGTLRVSPEIGMLKDRPFATAGDEPSLAEMLSDPVCQALMRADGVHVIEIISIIENLTRPRSL